MGLFDNLAPVLGAGAGALIGGPAGAMIGGQIGGAFMTNAANRDAAFTSGQMNQQSAREQMAFQERMSGTAHQREVEDLKAAGLNPILSANAGASAGPGASAQHPVADQENPLEGAAATALQMQQLKLAAAKQEKEIELMGSQKKKTDTETETLRGDAAKSRQSERFWNKLGSALDSSAKGLGSLADEYIPKADDLKQRGLENRSELNRKSFKRADDYDKWQKNRIDKYNKGN